MKRIIWTYGTIAGFIMGVMFFVTVPFWENGMINFDNGMWIGYTTMVIALSLVFVGVKSYRDNYSAGSITFWAGFKVGLAITAVASIIYALSWELAFNTVSKGFMDEMSKYYAENARKDATTEAELQQALKRIDEMNVMYQNFFIRFAMTLMEVLPVGILMTLISAAILRKKEILQANSDVQRT